MDMTLLGEHRYTFCFLILSVCLIIYILHKVFSEEQHIKYGIYEKILLNSNCSKDIPCEYETLHNRTRGLPLRSHVQLLGQLGIPPKSFVTLTPERLQSVVFMTAADHSHFAECRDFIASVQKHRPHDYVIFYDLGLWNYQVTELTKFCRIIYRKFNYDRYPDHIRYLKTYAFKVLALWEVLSEFNGVFYADCSIRLSSGDLTPLYPDLERARGGLMLQPTVGSVFSYTLPESFSYLPVNISASKITINREASNLLILKTKEWYWNVMHWWVLCALQRQCIAPDLHALDCHPRCDQGPATGDITCECHRYDQSVLNILVANYFNYNTTMYTPSQAVSVRIKYVTYMYEVEYCDKRNEWTFSLWASKYF